MFNAETGEMRSLGPNLAEFRGDSGFTASCALPGAEALLVACGHYGLAIPWRPAVGILGTSGPSLSRSSRSPSSTAISARRSRRRSCGASPTAQGIKLPTKDYWEFRDLITVPTKGSKSFDGYLQLFHWTELIQSSPLAVERSVYEVVGGAYRKNNITTMELRFNPMKRNRGGEQDLDHIIAAATRGMDRATPRVPGQAGADLLPRSGVSRTSSTRSSSRRPSPGATGASSASTSPARNPRPSASPTTAS